MTTLPQWIDYRQLPTSAAGFSSLFLDYIYNNAAVQQYFPLSFRDGSGYESVMAAIDAHGVDRATLSQVLHEQNVSLGAGQRAIENAALLSKPDTYAVVTGQQVSLFGGPLYTAFKTLTA